MRLPGPSYTSLDLGLVPPEEEDGRLALSGSALTQIKQKHSVLGHLTLGQTYPQKYELRR